LPGSASSRFDRHNGVGAYFDLASASLNDCEHVPILQQALTVGPFRLCAKELGYHEKTENTKNQKKSKGFRVCVAENAATAATRGCRESSALLSAPRKLGRMLSISSK